MKRKAGCCAVKKPDIVWKLTEGPPIKAGTEPIEQQPHWTPRGLRLPCLRPWCSRLTSGRRLGPERRWVMMRTLILPNTPGGGAVSLPAAFCRHTLQSTSSHKSLPRATPNLDRPRGRAVSPGTGPQRSPGFGAHRNQRPRHRQGRACNLGLRGGWACVARQGTHHTGSWAPLRCKRLG